MPTFASIQQEIAAMLEVADEALTPEQQSAMDEYLNDLAGQESDKVDAFAAFVKEQAARAEFLKAEAQRIAAKGRAIERRLDGLKEHYLHIMQAHGLSSVAGSTYTLSTRKSSRVDVPDVFALPEAYRVTKTETTPDRKAIAAALKAGEAVPGASIVEGVSLQIR